MLKKENLKREVTGWDVHWDFGKHKHIPGNLQGHAGIIVYMLKKALIASKLSLLAYL